MGGRPNNIKISKEKLLAAIKMRGYNRSQLIRELNTITYRTLDRNLSDGTMSYSTLQDICKILDIDPRSICDEESRVWTDYQVLTLPRDISEKYNTFSEWAESRTDSKMGFFPIYAQSEKDNEIENRKSQKCLWSEIFAAFAADYCPINKGRAHFTLNVETIQEIAPTLATDVQMFLTDYLSKKYKEYNNGKHKEKR